MKIYTLILIIICSFAVNLRAQVQIVKGVIYNKDTSLPIAYATVSTRNSSSGTISNSEGVFTITFDRITDSVSISHINYGSKVFIISKDNKNLQSFYMEPITTELEEVIVTSEPVSSILLKAVLISEEQISLPIYLDTYYREFVKTNNKYTKFSDGILSYFLDRKGKLKSTVWVKDSRAIELYDEKDEDINFDLTSPLDVRTSLDASIISHIKEFMIKENVYKYNFELRSQNRKGNNMQIITVSPKRSIKEHLYSAQIEIDTDTGLIMDVEYELADTHKQFAKGINVMVVKAKILDLRTKIIFKKTDQYYNIFYVLKDKTVKIWNKKKLDEKFRFTSDVVVIDVPTDQSPPNSKDRFKKRSLYKRNVALQSKFWLNSNAIDLTTEQQEIIKSLE